MVLKPEITSVYSLLKTRFLLGRGKAVDLDSSYTALKNVFRVSYEPEHGLDKLCVFGDGVFTINIFSTGKVIVNAREPFDEGELRVFLNDIEALLEIKRKVK